MKKTHNSYTKTLKYSKNLLKFGYFGFKTNNFKQISKEQELLILTSLSKKIKIISTKKKIKIWNNIYMNQNLTKLSLESRMGKGKGAIYTQATFIKPGTILFEIEKLKYEEALEIYYYINKKLPIKLILIKKNNN
uniref:Ribosomal protein L16 n=1 Tax=Dasya binghamiae TaxID=1896963 RepID=A0A1C8XRT0_9FLOR|nr:ribosomal protein L16 [Dasya binghamiae]AOH77201.1 ribosomal protein L16 [Dasya binghamiae]